MPAGPITHVVAGHGEPLLLLNGGLMTIASWNAIAAPLERSFRVIRCDFRGQLLSPGVPEPSIYPHVQDVIELLDHLDIESAHVAGTSFGGFVALRTAAMHQGRVRSVSAITVTDFITPEMAAGASLARDAALAAAAGGDRNRVLELIKPVTFTEAYIEANQARFEAQRAMAPALPSIFYEGLASIVGALDGLDLRDLGGAINCPAQIVAGEEDRMFPLAHSVSLATLLNARLVVLAGAPHGAVAERPADVASAIQTFVSEICH